MDTEPTTPKVKAGRPLLGAERLLDRRVCLGNGHVATAKALGDGNLSAGIRAALERNGIIRNMLATLRKRYGPGPLGGYDCPDSAYDEGAIDALFFALGHTDEVQRSEIGCNTTILARWNQFGTKDQEKAPVIIVHPKK